MISTIIVNIAWPAMNDATSGTYAEPNATIGSIVHITAGSTPINSMKTAPSTKPIAGARHGAHHPGAGGQRAAAQHRHRAEHHPEAVLDGEQVRDGDGDAPGRARCAGCCAPPPRGWRRSRWSDDAMASDSDITRSAAPESGSRRPSTRAHTGRASAAAATPMTRPVAPTHADIVRRVSNFRPDADRGGVVVGSPRISTMSSR